MNVHPPPTQVDIVHAHLRMRSGEVVPFATLRRALWGDAQPRWAGPMLGHIVAKVRKIIPAGCTIEAQRRRGYIMRIPERRDLHPFPPTPAATVPPQHAPRRKVNETTEWAAEKRAEAALRPPPKQRRCLCCRAEFPSEGAHHRMCRQCRTGAHAVSPYAL